jgi:hypothetical protein
MRNILIVLALLFIFGVVWAASEPDYDALAKAQKAEGNSSPYLSATYFLDILNATPDLRPKVVPGAYDSTRYTIPVGPYQVSLETRTQFNIFGVGAFSFNETAGSGKTYHQNNYKEYVLYMENRTKPGTFWYYTYVWIVRYIGPAEYPPQLTEKQFVSHRYDVTDMEDITIDGHPGSHELACRPKRDNSCFDVYKYALDPSTIVVIQSNMEWDKDISLAIETMHITSPSR